MVSWTCSWAGDACLTRGVPAARPRALHAAEIARADDAQEHDLLGCLLQPSDDFVAADGDVLATTGDIVEVVAGDFVAADGDVVAIDGGGWLC